MSSTEYLNPPTPYAFTTPTMRDFSHKVVRKNTNPRYKHFKQTFFTAGDCEQFETFRDDEGKRATSYARGRGRQEETHNHGQNKLQNKLEWIHRIDPIYNTRISRKDVTNTFKYIFFKFKKGIYIKIRNNRLETFLPFSNVNFVNEYADKLSVQGGTPKHLISFLKKTSKYRLNPQSVNYQRDTWFANNSLVRHEYPIAENDTNIPAIKDMFLVLLRERKIGNVDLFVNKRDNPILAEGKYEPYNHLFDSCTHPLVSHKYEAYAPVLSMSKTARHSDILFPTVDDWIRARAKNGRFFPRASNDYHPFPKLVNWDSKKKVALWRGSSTGVHINCDKNKRLKLAKLSQRAMLTYSEMDVPIDAGITSWKLRPRKIEGIKYLQTINVTRTGIRLVKPVSFKNHAHYKYLIDIEGHVAAYRLGALLGLGSVVLSVESEFSLWFSKYLQDGVHFVSVKADLSNLQAKLNWLKQNDDVAKKIADNGRAFFEKRLCKEGMLDFLSSLLNELSTTNAISDWKLVPKIGATDCFQKLILIKVVKKIYVQNQRSHVFLTSGNKVVKVALTPSAIRELHNEKNVYDTVYNYKKYCKEWLLSPMLDSGVNNQKYPISVFQEIQGKTLLQWICGPLFCPEKLSIFIKRIVSFTNTLCLLCNFVHYDLVPGNIVLADSTDGRTDVTVGVTPIIIDLGKSRVSDDSGCVFTSSNLRTQVVENQDERHLLLSCAYHIIRRKDASQYKTYAAALFERANPDSKKAESIKELKAATKRACKYSNLLHFRPTVGSARCFASGLPSFHPTRYFNFPENDANFLIDFVWRKLESLNFGMTYSELLRVRDRVSESKDDYEKAALKFRDLIYTDFPITKHELIDLLFFVKHKNNKNHVSSIYKYFSILLEIKSFLFSSPSHIQKKNYSFP